MKAKALTAALPAAALLLIPSMAGAQCDPVDFEAFSTGADATSIIPGVTFYALPQSCGGSPPVTPVVVEPLGTTSSGVKAVSITTGCPDFSPDYLGWDFDVPQTNVEFTVGLQSGAANLVIQVRWWDGGVAFSRNFITGGGVGTLVRLVGAAITTVEVENTISLYEAIDDLRFSQDTTPPTIEIDSPAYDTCVCGDDLLAVRGTVSDDDGSYGCDAISYRPINADQGSPWVPIGNACGPVTNGTLYVVDTAPFAAGRYYLRLVGENACGLVASDVTVIRVDRAFGTAVITGFDGGREDETLCGTVEVLGTIADGCGVDSWTLELVPPDQEPFTIATGQGGRQCVITEWDTRDVEDGDYELQLTATDNCGYTGGYSVPVTIVNEGFCQCGPDVNGDGEVNFADILLILANWS